MKSSLPALFCLIGLSAVASSFAQEPKKEAPAAEAPKPASGNPVVEMKTNLGSITIELNKEKAPITVANFLAYVEKKHYDGTVFHRVIDGFMIQGGGFQKNGNEFVEKETMKPIKNEGQNGLKNATYTIAMARTGDPDSATSQFFINVGENASLDYPKPDGFGYAVFGKVTKGQEVVNKIKGVPTGVKPLVMRGRSLPSQDVPESPVIIESVTLASAAPAAPAPAAEAPKAEAPKADAPK